MMIIKKKPNGKWGIIHSHRWLVQDFETETEAEGWADGNIDDQMFDGPNTFSPPLQYEDPVQ